MPIGKQSINRVAKKADTEEIKQVVAEQPTEAKKPSTAKKSASCKAPAKAPKKETAAKPAATPHVGGDVLDAPISSTVTEHVIANIDPAVVEAVVGKPTEAPKDGKVKVTDPMPSYLL